MECMQMCSVVMSRAGTGSRYAWGCLTTSLLPLPTHSKGHALLHLQGIIGCHSMILSVPGVQTNALMQPMPTIIHTLPCDKS